MGRERERERHTHTEASGQGTQAAGGGGGQTGMMCDTGAARQTDKPDRQAGSLLHGGVGGERMRRGEERRGELETSGATHHWTRSAV